LFSFITLPRFATLDTGTYHLRGSSSGSVSGLVRVFIDPSWKSASVFISGNSTPDTGKNIIATENRVAWDTLKRMDMSVTLFTKTQLDQQPSFSFDSVVVVNHVDKVARLRVVDLYHGNEQLNCNASVWYGMETGMIMGIDMHTLWKEQRLFDSRYFMTVVAKDIIAPTIAPTGPTRSPTLSPSALPSAVPTHLPSSPTVIPSSCPTTLTSPQPSVSPSVISSNSPSFNPSAAVTRPPSLNPSLSPSKFPTCAPSQSPTAADPPLSTAVSFTTDVALDGIDESMFDNAAQVSNRSFFFFFSSPSSTSGGVSECHGGVNGWRVCL
jgi:hypothetical protein